MILRLLRWAFRSAVLIVTVGVAVPVAVIATVLASLFFLPLPAAIPQPKTPATILPTQVFDRNGNLIATFRQFDLSFPVKKADIPTVLKEAVVAVEDRRLLQARRRRRPWQPFGPSSPTSATRRPSRAGSTITQQYVKNAYTGGARTLSRKVARGGPGQPDRPADLQGRDSVPLPVDHLPGRRQLRHRGRRGELLPQTGQPAHRVRGGHAGRAHPRSEPLGSPGEPRCRRESHGSSSSTRCCSRAT